MNQNNEVIKNLREIYAEKKPGITKRIEEFREIYRSGSERDVFRELSFCIFSSGAGPRMAGKSVDAIDDMLLNGNEEEMTERLKGVHKFPEKSAYIVSAREYFRNEYDMKIKKALSSIDDRDERRDFLVKNIKGVGYLQASHFLRNIGFSGYAILDKNILRSLYDFGVITDTKPPSTKKRYLEKEKLMKEFADYLEIDFDHLDLLLWFMIRGQIPR